MEDNYQPYGKEWVKEMMRLTKADLIELYKKRCLDCNEMEEKLRWSNLDLKFNRIDP